VVIPKPDGIVGREDGVHTENAYGIRLAAVDLVASYCSIWNETDPDRRARAFEQIWAEDGVLVQPRAGRVQGRAAVLSHIAGFSHRFPGAQVIQTSDVDEHHGHIRYTWRIAFADGATSIDGLDIGVVDASGRFREVIQFHDPFPSVNAPLSRADNQKSTVRRVFEEVVNRQRLDVLDEIVAPDFVLHSATLGEVRGREVYRQSIQGLLRAVPDLHGDIDALLAGEHDHVVARLRYTGSDQAGFITKGIDTGKPFEATAVYLWRLEGDMLKELWQELTARVVE
jgi:predicted ester cyclase